MGNLIYAAITSLDGYIEDTDGGFGWAQPDPEVHAFANELERGIGTHLYGRRMYETMAVWQTIDEESADSAEEADFGRLWRSLDKVVYSTSLDAVSTPRTRLERTFDPRVRQSPFFRFGLSFGFGNDQQGWSARVAVENLTDRNTAILIRDVPFGDGNFTKWAEPQRLVY